MDSTAADTQGTFASFTTEDLRGKSDLYHRTFNITMDAIRDMDVMTPEYEAQWSAAVALHDTTVLINKELARRFAEDTARNA